MKKVLSVLMITIMLFSTTMFPVSAANGEIGVYLDAAKIEFDVKPRIINGRTMVPIRAIFEKMGAMTRSVIIDLPSSLSPNFKVIPFIKLHSLAYLRIDSAL